MPGTMFIQPAALAGLPTEGTAWDRLVAKAGAAVPAGNLAQVDQPQALDIFSVALRWAKDGGGAGKQYVVDHIKAVMGTETASSDLYPYRAMTAYVLAADLVDMDGSEVGANGQTFSAWLQSLPATIYPGASQYNTMYKAATSAGHYWGNHARASLLAISLWLVKHGLNPVGTGLPATATAMRDEVIAVHKRWAGDTSVPNTLKTTVSYLPEWAVLVYPTTQGAVNPVTSDVVKNGASVVDASLSGPPPLTGGPGKRQTFESLDAVDAIIIMLINAGYGDAAGWGDNAVRRVYQWLMANNLTTVDTDFNHWHWHQGWFANHLWSLNFPIPEVDGAQRRHLTTHLDWLTSAGSTWLTTAGSGGGGTPPPPVIVAPTVSFTLTRTDQTVALDAAGSLAGSAPIARHVVSWGDGTTTTITEPTRTASKTYAGGTTYTVSVRAEATDGGQATSNQSIQVPNAAGAPVTSFVISTSVTSPEDPVLYSFAGTVAPEGETLTYEVDWGDGTVITDAPESGSYTYQDVEDTASFSVLGVAATTTAASDPVVRTVTVTSLAALKNYYEGWYVGSESGPIPVFPPYESTWDGFHLKIGTQRIWRDNTGTLRTKDGAPLAHDDGVPLGSGAGGGFGVVAINQGDPVPNGTPAGTFIFEQA